MPIFGVNDSDLIDDCLRAQKRAAVGDIQLRDPPSLMPVPCMDSPETQRSRQAQEKPLVSVAEGFSCVALKRASCTSLHGHGLSFDFC